MSTPTSCSLRSRISTAPASSFATQPRQRRSRLALRMRDDEEQREQDADDAGAVEDLDLGEDVAQEIRGGLSPPSPPSGPIPIPYPNKT